MHNIMQAINIVKTFGGLRALDGVEFSVRENSITSIIGPNGSGKTTFLNCINGIYRPDKGDIKFKGKSIVGLKPHVIARLGIGRTFQISRVFRKISVIENILATVLDSHKPNEQLRKEAYESLERVDMLGLKDSLGEELSGGQQKLLELAIPYRIARGVEFYNRKEIKDLLAYLKAMVNVDDEIAWERIINTPATVMTTKPNAVSAATIFLFTRLAMASSIQLYR